ncbi:MAG TPA: tetratricopeptide repeat protein [Polyangiaceae bacterium]|nr:tetratricopeptide repeat protein [Polyangiaceae bacterium]
MLEQLFQNAVERHRAGDLVAAEGGYREVLSANAEHDLASFLLGSLLHESTRTEEGIGWLTRAVELCPDNASYRAALAEMHARAGQHARALALFESAAHLEPHTAHLQLLFGCALFDGGEQERAIGYLQCALLSQREQPEARARLAAYAAERLAQRGYSLPSANAPSAQPKRSPQSTTRSSPMIERAFRVAQEHHRAGRIKDAEAHYRKLLKVEPKHVEGLFWYGSLALESDRVPYAIDMLTRAAALAPSNADYHSNLGEACVLAKQFEQSISGFERALALEPARAERHFNLAIAHRLAGDRAAALAGLERANLLAPANAQFQLEFARELQDDAQARRALGHFQCSLALSPDPGVYLEFASALRGLAFAEATIRACDHSLRLENRASAQHLLGLCSSDAQRLDEAIASFERALAMDATVPRAHADLALALLGNGRVEDAVAHWELALQLDPSDAVSGSNRLFALAFHEKFSDAQIADEAKGWAARYETPLATRVREHAPPGAAHKKLRLGLVCSVFREHALGFVILPLLAHRSREQYELYCYSSVTHPDALTARMRRSADVWRDVAEHSDEELAEVIRADGIDVLFDLNMHMATSRLRTFAYRPAPVQITGWSYPGTTGLSHMDYRVTDRYLDPPGEISPFSESALVLPDSYWCYDPGTDQPKVAPLPALTRGAICFGNLNGSWKLNQRSAALWSKVLHAVTGSRLLLLSPGWQNGGRRSVGQAQQRLASFFEDAGIAAERIVFLPRTSRLRYFDYYAQIDVCLDSLPYAGHTTSLDALWMGVPTVSLRGQTIVGRSGVTLSQNLGMPELVTSTETEFVERAVELTNDLAALAQLRLSLRARLEASKLMDGPRFARNMEAAFRAAWRCYCEGKRPARIDIPG